MDVGALSRLKEGLYCVDGTIMGALARWCGAFIVRSMLNPTGVRGSDGLKMLTRTCGVLGGAEIWNKRSRIQNYLHWRTCPVNAM